MDFLLVWRSRFEEILASSEIPMEIQFEIVSLYLTVPTLEVVLLPCKKYNSRFVLLIFIPSEPLPSGPSFSIYTGIN